MGIHNTLKSNNLIALSKDIDDEFNDLYSYYAKSHKNVNDLRDLLVVYLSHYIDEDYTRQDIRDVVTEKIKQKQHV